MFMHHIAPFLHMKIELGAKRISCRVVKKSEDSHEKSEDYRKIESRLDFFFREPIHLSDDYIPESRSGCIGGLAPGYRWIVGGLSSVLPASVFVLTCLLRQWLVCLVFVGFQGFIFLKAAVWFFRYGIAYKTCIHKFG